MKQKYLRYYDRYSKLANLSFLWDGLWAGSRIAKQALLNRQKDYLRIESEPRLFALHRELNRCLWAAAQEWDALDYGAGYFYQGFDSIGVSGMRDTRSRVEAMGLRELLRRKVVLDVGCNSGFLALSVADVAERIVGFDLNPHLIEVARIVADHLGIENAEFRVCGFEEFSSPVRFDAVLSLANHATVDGNTRQSVDEYFRRCRDLIAPGGLMLFESHPPDVEGKGAPDVCAIIDRLFDIEDRQVLDCGTVLDRERTFIVARCPMREPAAPLASDKPEPAGNYVQASL